MACFPASGDILIKQFQFFVDETNDLRASMYGCLLFNCFNHSLWSVEHGKRSPGCLCEHMSLNDHVLNELLDDDTNTCTILFQNNKGTLVFCSLVKDNHGIVFLCNDFKCCSKTCALNLLDKTSTYR